MIINYYLTKFVYNRRNSVSKIRSVRGKLQCNDTGLRGFEERETMKPCIVTCIRKCKEKL